MTGWVAHYNEQLQHNKLFRPDAVYVGANDLDVRPDREPLTSGRRRAPAGGATSALLDAPDVVEYLPRLRLA